MEMKDVEQQWKTYSKAIKENKELDADTHALIANHVGGLINEIKRLTDILERNDLPLYPCDDCGKEEQNPGLSVCGECYHKRIWGK